VYGFIQAASHGWGNRMAVGSFVIAAALLAAFLANESRVRQPITPLRLFADRGRTGSYLTRLLLVAGMFGMFYFLTQFVQDILGFSPLRAGISFLPMTAALFSVSRLSPRLLARFGAKPLMVAGLVPAVIGMAWLSRISPGSDYVSGVLGPMLLLGAGMGVAFVPLTMASLAGVQPRDSGAASSMVNVTQQVGGSLGLAILVTAFATASRNAARHPAHLASLAQAHQQAIVHGMASAFTLAAIFDVLALLIVVVIIRDRKPQAAGASARESQAQAAAVSATAGELEA
jgi:predicted MFS family arabinose efflux permease